MIGTFLDNYADTIVYVNIKATTYPNISGGFVVIN